MEYITKIPKIALEIYKLVDNVKANKKRCQRVAERVKALVGLVRSIEKRDKIESPAEVEKALKELSITLESAQELIEKYTLANWIQLVLKSRRHGDEFSSVNERLNDAFQVLSGALQVEQGNVLYKVFKQTSREKDDEVDGRTDDEELKTLILGHMEEQKEKMDALLNNVLKFMEMSSKPRPSDEDIRMIKPDELSYDHPKEPFLKTPCTEVYKGQYRGFTVAIKRYIAHVILSASEVQKDFKKDVETMKQFESPNILRMFGICVQDENGPNPQFLIITEYCEKGSLRQVLDSNCTLTWTMKARMCLDAAQGLYRLHQTEKKSTVHRCINSSKFLVDENYRVKLGGFEMTKTESSLRNSTGRKQINSLCYSSPQLFDINHKYGKECEIYSLGIVLWEIVTRQEPFKGYSNKEIQKKVSKEKYQEPLPDDCPEPLGCLINDCRTYDSFLRPSTGVMVDRLRSVVAQMEKE